MKNEDCNIIYNLLRVGVVGLITETKIDCGRGCTRAVEGRQSLWDLGG